jgi:hypothetical protein
MTESTSAPIKEPQPPLVPARTQAAIPGKPKALANTAMAQLKPALTGELLPEFVTIPTWCAMSGMSRSLAYELAASGDIVMVKLRGRSLIHVPPSLAWMRTLPPAKIKAPAGK